MAGAAPGGATAAGPERAGVVAAIDIGTNSVLMSIAKPARARAAAEPFELVVDRASITRLGRGVDASKRLEQAAIQRTLAVLEQYAAEARSLGARVAAVGTSALRDARNARAFLDPAEAALGAEIEVIEGTREAELSFAGAMAGLPVDPERVTLVDVGGGSTEIVRRVTGALHADSLDIGAVRLHERHALGAPASATQLEAVRNDARAALASSRVQPGPTLVAVGGTATTLAAIAGEVEPYDRARIHGRVLERKAIDELCARLAALPSSARTRVPGLAAGRADIIVAGALILSCVCERASVHRVTVSDGGVRIGLLLEMLGDFRIDPSYTCD